MTAPIDASRSGRSEQSTSKRPAAFEGLSRISLPAAQAADLLRQRLDSFTHDSFLSFAVIGSAISIWFADDRGMRFHVAESNVRELLEVVESAYSLCASPASDARAALRVGDFLYQALFGPIEYLLTPDRRLWIHFSADFPCIPLSLLRNAKREFFMDLYAVGLASRFPEQDSPACDHGRFCPARALVVDLTVGGEQETNVSTARLERRRSDLKLLGSMAPSSHVLDATAATAEAFAQLAPDSNLLFLRGAFEQGSRGPALLFPANGTGSGTVANSNSHGNAYEPIHLLEAEPEWLSACRLALLDITPLELSARGANGQQPNYASAAASSYAVQQVVRSLHGVGVSRVLAPLWPSPQESRDWFCRRFTSNLHLGMAIEDAAQKALAEIRHTTHWQHPHHWAAFQLSFADVTLSQAVS